MCTFNTIKYVILHTESLIMSKKSWFSSSLTTEPTVTIPAAAPIPRTKAEIDQEYTSLCALAGQVQYQAENSKAHLNQINYKIQKVNQEADARAKLDAEEKAKVVTEASNV